MAEVRTTFQKFNGYEMPFNHTQRCLSRLTEYQGGAMGIYFLFLNAPQPPWHKGEFWILYTHMDTSNGY